MNALWDRAPLILLTSTVEEGFAIKERLVVTPAAAAQQIARALGLALADPRGPVQLEIPADVAGRPSALGPLSQAQVSLPHPEAEALDRAAQVIAGARYPVLITGLECRGVGEAKWLRALAESVPAPVLTTLKAKGIFPDSHPLALGIFPGGTREQAIVGRADLIVAIGLDPVELAADDWPCQAPVVRLVRTPHPGEYFVPVAQVTGDIALIIEELAPRLRRKTRADWDVALLDRLKREPMERRAGSTRALAPHRVVQIARELAPAGSVVAVDREALLVAAAVFWQAEEPGTFLIPNRQPAAGFALPAAIAAQLVHRDRRVLCLTAASGLMGVIAEVETVVRLNLPLLILVFNDPALFPAPDLSILAQSFGITAFRADREGELRDALTQALAGGIPALVDARIVRF